MWVIVTMGIISSSLLGCGDNGTDKLVNIVLEDAGDNACELQYVLEYYSDSTEKFIAAQWLIANMGYHYSYDSELFDSIEAELDPLTKSISLVSSIGESNLRKWEKRDIYSSPKLFDHKNVKSEYLIDNIDRAFEQYRKRPWNKNLSFDKFCELILPYRVGDERLTKWRPIYESKYAVRLDSLMTDSTTLFDACMMIHKWVREDGEWYNNEIRSPHRDALALFNSPIGSCRDDCDKYVFAMRSCGIPATSHHLLCSPDNATSHQWVAIFNPSTGKYHPFGYDDMTLCDTILAHDGRTKGKVYVFRYEPNIKRYSGIESSSPNTLKISSPFLYDVTANYFNQNTAEVKIGDKVKKCALGVYAKLKYHVIDYGNILKSGIAEFKDIEPGIIYFPIDLDIFQPCGQPFLITSYGKVIQFNPNMDSVSESRLNRKMPLTMRNLMWLDSLMVGTRLSANEQVILSIDTPFQINYKKFKLSKPVLTDRLKLSPPLGQPLSIAELSITDVSGRTVEYSISGHDLAPLINDGDILTLFYAPYGESVELNLKRQSRISSVSIVPRNDDNFVWPGQKYELLTFYNNSWVSCGYKVANNHFIDFDVPKGGVYLLRNLSKGMEEQVFIMVDGKQMFSLDISGSYHKRGLFTGRDVL